MFGFSPKIALLCNIPIWLLSLLISFQDAHNIRKFFVANLHFLILKLARFDMNFLTSKNFSAHRKSHNFNIHFTSNEFICTYFVGDSGPLFAVFLPVFVDNFLKREIKFVEILKESLEGRACRRWLKNERRSFAVELSNVWGDPIEFCYFLSTDLCIGCGLFCFYGSRRSALNSLVGLPTTHFRDLISNHRVTVSLADFQQSLTHGHGLENCYWKTGIIAVGFLG